MVDAKIDYENKQAVFKTDKTKITYTLEKDVTGFCFYEFKASKGPLPKELEGKFNSLDKGKEAFEKFDRNKKVTVAKYSEQRQKAKNEQLQSKASK
jgi:hypothetical protein